MNGLTTMKNLDVCAVNSVQSEDYFALEKIAGTLGLHMGTLSIVQSVKIIGEFSDDKDTQNIVTSVGGIFRHMCPSHIIARDVNVSIMGKLNGLKIASMS